MADNAGIYKHPSHQIIISMAVDASSADINVGDALTTSGASAGYVMKVDGVGEPVIGFADSKVSSPDADGDVMVKVDVSKEVLYRLPPDTGSVTQALVGLKRDIGADGRSVDVDGTTTSDLEILGIDEDNDLYILRRV